MLPDEDLEKLCHGRIIKARVYDSSKKNATVPHYCIILDDDDQIRKHGKFAVVVISNNDKIDSRFLMPVPSRSGLQGNVIGSWVAEIAEPGVTSVLPTVLLPPEMIAVHQLVTNAANDRTSGKEKR
jgi:hypothetical protein